MYLLVYELFDGPFILNRVDWFCFARGRYIDRWVSAGEAIVLEFHLFLLL